MYRVSFLARVIFIHHHPEEASGREGIAHTFQGALWEKYLCIQGSRRLSRRDGLQLLRPCREEWLPWGWAGGLLEELWPRERGRPLGGAVPARSYWKTVSKAALVVGRSSWNFAKNEWILLFVLFTPACLLLTSGKRSIAWSFSSVPCCFWSLAGLNLVSDLFISFPAARFTKIKFCWLTIL